MDERKIIYLDDAIDAIEKLHIPEDMCVFEILSHIELAISTLPSAEPDITACGDCKHYIPHDKRCGYWNHGVKPLEWCSHAERRTDGRPNQQTSGD